MEKTLLTHCKYCEQEIVIKRIDEMKDFAVGVVER